MAPIDLLPARIKYYLLDWKDLNISEFVAYYGDVKLKELTLSQLHELFSMISTRDSSLILQEERQQSEPQKQP